MNQTIRDMITRRSIRSFKTEQIREEDLAEILTAAKFAPTALNTQSLHFTVVQNPEIIAEISAVNRELILTQPDSPLRERAQSDGFCNFYHAPTVILISSDDLAFGVADAANAAENICIAAHSLQLGSCYIASFLPAFSSPEAPRLRCSLKIPEGKIPRFAVALGYINGKMPEAPPRKENNVTVIE
ncbi:MAG: nitroreductase family protein [Clostridia bacterium]